MKRIGWLADAGRWEGGAEMAAREIAQAAPAGVKVIPCPAGDVREDVDAYVIHNCVQYDAALIERLGGKPVVKVLHDTWPYGDTTLRTWLLKNARLFILGSPVQRDSLPWKIAAPVKLLPHSVNFAPYREAARRAKERKGVVWFGRLAQGKGLAAARAWAIANKTEIDVYGFGPLQDTLKAPLNYRGQVDHKHMPELITRYKTFLFLPDANETYNRATVEAYAAGCELVINENTGALWWIQNQPEQMEQATRLMWNAILEAVA